jgi:hypothetical protein
VTVRHYGLDHPQTAAAKLALREAVLAAMIAEALSTDPLLPVAARRRLAAVLHGGVR